MATVTKRRKKIPVSQDERDRMLFWWTFYKGNCSKTARKVSEETGISRSRKVVFETSKRYNFATMAHIVRDDVIKQVYSTDTPGIGRIVKVSSDVMDVDEQLVDQANRFLQGYSNTKVKNIDQVIKIVEHVTKNLNVMTGSKDIQSDALEKIAEKEGPRLRYSMDEILNKLSDEERAEVLTEIANEQTMAILEMRGERSTRQKKRDRQANKRIKKQADKAK